MHGCLRNQGYNVASVVRNLSSYIPITCSFCRIVNLIVAWTAEEKSSWFQLRPIIIREIQTYRLPEPLGLIEACNNTDVNFGVRVIVNIRVLSPSCRCRIMERAEAFFSREWKDLITYRGGRDHQEKTLVTLTSLFNHQSLGYLVKFISHEKR